MGELLHIGTGPKSGWLWVLPLLLDGQLRWISRNLKTKEQSHCLVDGVPGDIDGHGTDLDDPVGRWIDPEATAADDTRIMIICNDLLPAHQPIA